MAAPVSAVLVALLAIEITGLHWLAMPSNPAEQWTLSALTGALWFFAMGSYARPHVAVRLLKASFIGLRRRVRGWKHLMLGVITEEAVWRGSVLAVLHAAHGAIFAMAFSSVAFGTWHANRGIRGVIGNIANGIVFGLVALYLGGFTSSMLAHISYNFVLIGAVVGARPEDGVRH